MTQPWRTQLKRECRRSDSRLRTFASEHAALAWAYALKGGRDRVGITRALAVIADTASVVLCGADGQPRRDSLLVTHHIALARSSDIYPDLLSFLSSLPDENLHSERGSHLTFITGPSRTADIEKVLVTPAHGPAKLTIALIV